MLPEIIEDDFEQSASLFIQKIDKENFDPNFFNHQF